MKLWLLSVMAFLIMASASLVGAQTLQTLCSFNYTNGAGPAAALTLGIDGNFYGTTSYGGSGGGGSSGGTVFQVTTNGTVTTLASSFGTNGSSPRAALTLASDGNFYGTTYSGGSSGLGTVFKVTTNGALIRLASFSGTNGEYPTAALTLASDDNFYGTTYSGGSSGLGTVFKVTTNGALTTLFSFSNTNGVRPQAALTLGNDGNFYGTTFYGGSNGYGTVFTVTTNGTLTTLVSFANTNGRYPQAALTWGNDGSFYGTTADGGSSYDGTVFKVTTNGTLTTLVSFSYDINGSSPEAALTLGNDGNFYGTTAYGGSNGYGTVFTLTTNGTLVTLFSFSNTNGANPQAALTLGSDGDLYGTTHDGGSGNYGTVFRLLLPPIITVQPQSQTSNAGANVMFLVSATSLHPMSYQWQKNGTNLVDGGNFSGATTNTLTITGISDIDAASYSIIVSNSNGSVTSSNATLTVIYPPIITAQPTNLLVLPGTNAAFGVSLTGSSLFFRYQWRFNGTNLLNATNAIYTIPAVGTNDAGNYSVVITNAAGSATSSNAALTVVLSPTSRTNHAGSTATFTATAFSPETLNYQWQKNGTNLDYGGNISGATNSTLTIASVSDADAASYSAVVSDDSGSVTTSNAVLTVNNLPFIATHPQSQIVLVGSNVTFTAAAFGALPLVFQWYYSDSPAGSPTSGTNVSSYTLTNVGTNQAGNYSVQVINGYGSVTSFVATLTVVASPPTITSQPVSRTNKPGTTATFSVVASSVDPRVYQWQKDGTNLVNGGKISGATNSTLTITTVSDNDAGSYCVTVANLAGSVTSSNALLTVIVPPKLALQFLAGYPLLELYGMLGSNFVVEYNTNLPDKNWMTLLSLTNLSASPYQFLDPAGIGQPMRFYRAFMQ
jgi:uncharacterized repeat protein (TIGR03803 family)